MNIRHPQSMVSVEHEGFVVVLLVGDAEELLDRRLAVGAIDPFAASVAK
jgi:hypothetical protein